MAETITEVVSTLNKQQLTQPFLAQQGVEKGGTLVFVMGTKPAEK